MHTISKYLQKISTVFVGLCMISIVVNVVIQIVGRQILRISVPWSEEFARFSLVWMVLIAASIQVRKRGHFVVDIITAKLTERGRTIHRVAVYIIIIAVGGFLLYYGYEFTLMGFNRWSAMEQFTMNWVYAAFPVGASLIVFYGVEMLLEDVGILSPVKTEEISITGPDDNEEEGA